MLHHSKKLFSAALVALFCAACGDKEPAVYYSSEDQASEGEQQMDYTDNQDFDFGTYNPGTSMNDPQQSGNQTGQQPDSPVNQQPGAQQPQAQLSNIENYLVQLYKNLYGRAPDINGMDYWVNAYETGSAGCKAITHSFLFGGEILGLRNEAINGNRVAKLTYLNALYRGVLGRAPDAAGRAYYIAELDRGLPIPNLEGSFLLSDEFKKRCASFSLDY